MAAPPVRDWSFAGAMLRWERAAKLVLPDHAALPYVDAELGVAMLCRCDFRGRGPAYLSHLNEMLTAAIKD